MYRKVIAKPQSELKRVVKEVGVYTMALQEMHIIAKRLPSKEIVL